MNKLIITATLLAMTAAAQLPSAIYLPQAPGGGQGPNQVQGTYLPPAPGVPGGGQGPNKVQGTYLPPAPGAPGSNGENSGNTRPQQAAEKNAAILKADQEITENGFHYAYETSNGIQAEESGDVAQSRGAFAYKGDDGQIYSITFTAGEDGFRPQGAHLPVPPPTPQEILEALKQNERDEAAGIFDDGQYHPENNGQNQGSSGQGYGPNKPQSSSISGYSY